MVTDPAQADINEIAAQFLAERMVWISTPELQHLLEFAREQYRRMLALIPIKDLIIGTDLVGKYTWWECGTDEPDDGIFLKGPENNDPSAIRLGRPPDRKIYFQVRKRTQGLFQKKGVYRPDFAMFFRIADELRRRLDVRIRQLLEELTRQRPELGELEYDEEATVIRFMVYKDAREDDPDFSGQMHLDKCSLTMHLGDSRPALVVIRANGERELVPTRPGKSLPFLSEKLARILSIPALEHGAAYCRDREVVVCFVHLRRRAS